MLIGKDPVTEDEESRLEALYRHLYQRYLNQFGNRLLSGAGLTTKDIQILHKAGYFDDVAKITAIEKGTKITGTVWDDIKPTQAVVEGTSIPKSFELNVNGQKFWVNPNGTKHMIEYSTRNLSHGRKLTEQQLLASLQASTAEAIAKGYQFNVPIKVGNWEIIFSPAREIGQLPVIKHAQYIP